MSRPNNLTQEILIAYVIVGLAAVVIFFRINRILCPDSKIRQILQNGTEPEDLSKNVKTGEIDNARLEQLKQMEAEELKLVALFPKTLGFFVIRGAVAEFPAILGLVSTILSGNIVYFYSFAAPSLILKILNKPNAEEWQQRLREIASDN